MDKVYYIGSYKTQEDNTRLCSQACINKMNYIIDLIRENEYEIEILSTAESINISSFYRKEERIYLSDYITINQIPAIKSKKYKNQIHKLIIIIWLIIKLIQVPRKSRVILYHGLEYIIPLSFILTIKKFNIVLELEEIYSKMPNCKYSKTKELNFINKFDKIIYVSDTLKNEIGKKGFSIYGNYNIIDDCVFAFNGNTGLNINGNSSNTIEKWPSNNLIKNCTSYGNYDWNRDDGNQGEDADGFGAKLCLGINNVFDGCIAYNNSDDGWDLFTKHKTGKIGAVTIKNCIAFNNGYAFDGTSMKNGNGFKLGGRALEVDHVITNSIAFNNKANGFDDNSNPGTITVTNCTGYNNGARNFATGRFLEENNTYKSTWYEDEDLFGPIENVKKSHNVFDGVLSYKGGTTDSYSGVAQNSYFYDNSGKFVIFDALSDCNSKYKIGTKYIDYLPFKSLEIKLDLYNIHYSLRNSDGSINLGDYLKPIDNITAGARL